MIETLGRYKILSIIGQGAMGVVYKAIDPMIDRTVAIKTVNLSLNKDELEEYELRFQQEIKAAGRLNHPNIVTVYDVGRTESMAYMAMEFLEGRELKDILAEGERPAVTEVVDWIAQIANGLQFAHDHDIIHRDVKPSNIMLVRGGLAKITDFGIARMPASAVKTMTGLILGSPRYMSPEQVIGRDLDNRTDIFSLGVVLYETLSGMPPFDGDNVNAIMYATVNNIPPAPSISNPEVPTMLDLIATKALAKMPEERYQSMQEFANDLGHVKRQLLARQPANVIAKQAPPSARPLSLDALGVGRYQKDPDTVEEARPLKLAKDFDSFDATLKLAAMTNQTAEFEQYISESRKMRAYQGDVLGPLATAMSAGSRAGGGAPSALKPTMTFEQLDQLEQFEALKAHRASQAQTISPANNLVPIVIIVILAILAVGLSIALMIR